MDRRNICPRSEVLLVHHEIFFRTLVRQKLIRIQFQLFIFYETRLFTEKFSRTTTIHPGFFGGRALCKQ